MSTSQREHVSGERRDVGVLFPQYIEDYVGAENPARVVDAFVAGLDLRELGFSKTDLADVGRKPYNPADMLRLYIWGNLNRVRSSRRLEQEAQRNLEVMWLLRKLTPDDKTIANFRKENAAKLKGVLVKFNLVCQSLELFGKESVAVDGSRFAAVNSKKRNFTQEKLDKRIKEIGEQIDQYLKELEANDKEEESLPKETAESIAQKIKWLKERLEQCGALREEMKESGEKQVSLTDPDSRAMYKNGSTDVGFNVQVAVDSKHNMISTCEVTNAVNDKEQLAPMAEAAKKALGVDKLEVLADKGYYTPEQIAKCEEQGGITTFVPLVNTAAMHKGEIPSPEYENDKFAYNQSADTYTCPQGQTLVRIGEAQKRYATKACVGCIARHLCTANKEGRIISRSDFAGATDRLKQRVAQNPDKTKIRGQIVEPVFGAIKHAMEFLGFKLRGRLNADGEFSMVALAYNMKRAMNVLSVPVLLATLRNGSG